ncbi:MAG TPA: hypothetical protein VLB02_00785 [Candidatus Paceibacterota bacterium]|nr:hypothetical protein [Candidatus Paceibacterota bacterium]
MDPELKGRLKVIEDKLEKNHQLLVRIRRVQKNAGLFRLFYWLVVIGIAFGSFYYLSPYLTQIKKLYSDASDTFNFSTPEVKSVKNLWNQLNGNGENKE